MLTISLCLVTLGAWFIYACCTVIYRLLYHPLAYFPGPKLAAATKWYELYFDLIKLPKGTFVYEIERMHERYGKRFHLLTFLLLRGTNLTVLCRAGTIVRINPDELHIKDTEWVGTLYTGPTSVRTLHLPTLPTLGFSHIQGSP